jgi:hypothetical protein
MKMTMAQREPLGNQKMDLPSVLKTQNALAAVLHELEQLADR